jgi:hypothetical protein
LTLRDLAEQHRIRATGHMSSSAAIVHQILHGEAAHTRQEHGAAQDHAQTLVLRAILRMAEGLETAWARVASHRG